MNPIEQWFRDRHPDGINMTPEVLAAEIVEFVLNDLRARYPDRDEEFYAYALNDFAKYFTGEMLKLYGLKVERPS